jgi:hypothetical protein
VLVNAVYLFQGSGRALGSYSFSSKTMRGVADVAPGWMPVPLPRAYVEGFDAQKWEAEGRLDGFVLGERYGGTRWYFYPVTLLAKTPVGTIGLALLAAGVAVADLRGRRAKVWDERTVVAGIVVVAFGVATAMLIGINIGLRYLLPAYPAAYVLVSRVWAGGTRRVWASRAASAMVVLAAGEMLLGAAPDYLSFVNVAWGGPRDGWKVVNDSNFDWGQDLGRLKRWMDEHGVRRVHLGYFGRVDPAVYGVDATPLNEVSGERYIVVSTYLLAGLETRLPGGAAGLSGRMGLPFHRELAAKRPAAVVGRTLYVYERATVAEAMREWRQGGGGAAR